MLPSLGSAYDWLKNWLEAYIWNPLLDLFGIVKDGAAKTAGELLRALTMVRAFLSFLKKRFVEVVLEAIRRASLLIDSAEKKIVEWVYSKIAQVREFISSVEKNIVNWVYSKLAALQELFSSIEKRIIDWVYSKIADIWKVLSQVYSFFSQLDDWFARKFRSALEASGALLYDILVRFIDMVW